MADVQLEHGHTRIADALYEALIRAAMPGRHKDVVHAVIRLTYGYPKLCGPQNERKMGAALIRTLVPIQERRVRRILTDLEKWGLIERSRGANGSTPAIRLVKDFELWRLPEGADPDKREPGPQEDRVTGGPGTSRTGDPAPTGTGDPGHRGTASRDISRDNLETLPSGGARVPRSYPRGPTDPPEALSSDQRAQLRAWVSGRDLADPASRLTDGDLLGAEEACLDWHRGKGRRAKDWVATVRTWIRRDLKGNPARASPRPTKLERIAQAVRKSEEREHERQRQRETQDSGDAVRALPEG